MNHANGLATLVYDTVTGTNGDTVSDHFAETGQQWIELANAAGIDIQSNQWDGDAINFSVHLGMSVPSGAKKIQYRIDHTAASFITVDYLVAFGVGVLADGGNFAEGTILIDVGGAGNKALNIRTSDGIGGTVAGTLSAASLTFDAALNPYSLIVERLGSVIKAYLAEEPDSSVEWDMANSSIITDFESSAFIGVQDITAVAATRLNVSGVSVEY